MHAPQARARAASSPTGPWHACQIRARCMSDSFLCSSPSGPWGIHGRGACITGICTMRCICSPPLMCYTHIWSYDHAIYPYMVQPLICQLCIPLLLRCVPYGPSCPLPPASHAQPCHACPIRHPSDIHPTPIRHPPQIPARLLEAVLATRGRGDHRASVRVV